MSIALMVCLIGGAIHLATWLMNENAPIDQIKRLSAYAFFAGLLAFLLGK